MKETYRRLIKRSIAATVAAAALSSCSSENLSCHNVPTSESSNTVGEAYDTSGQKIIKVDGEQVETLQDFAKDTLISDLEQILDDVHTKGNLSKHDFQGGAMRQFVVVDTHKTEKGNVENVRAVENGPTLNKLGEPAMYISTQQFSRPEKQALATGGKNDPTTIYSLPITDKYYEVSGLSAEEVTKHDIDQIIDLLRQDDSVVTTVSAGYPSQYYDPDKHDNSLSATLDQDEHTIVMTESGVFEPKKKREQLISEITDENALNLARHLATTSSNQ